MTKPDAAKRAFEAAFARQRDRDDLAEGHLGVHRWHLRRAAAPVAPAALAPEHQIIAVRNPPPAYYRFLYAAVGADWLWYERAQLADDALAALLAPETTAVHVLFERGAPMGYFELDAADPGCVDLAYFGLAPWAVGRGLGPRLLAQAIATAGGDRVAMTVNTCTLDHPAALALYQAHGFRVEREVEFSHLDPRALGLVPEGAHPAVPIARPR